MFKYNKFLLIFGILSVSTLSVFAQIQFTEANALSLNPSEYYTAPTPSPDGKFLALSSLKYAGIQLLDLSTNQLTQVDESQAAGWRMKWAPSSSALIFRGTKFDANNRKEHAIQLYNLNTAAKVQYTDWSHQAQGLPVFATNADEAVYFEKATSPSIQKNAVVAIDIKSEKRKVDSGLSAGSVAYQFSDASVYQFGQNGSQTVVHSNENGYPILDVHTFNDEFIIIEEVGSPILRKNLKTGQIDELAQGEEAAISPDGQFLVFRYSMDDGHDYIYSELVLMNLSTKEIVDRYSSSEVMPFSPAWKADGSAIFFADRLNGSIYELQIEEVK